MERNPLYYYNHPQCLNCSGKRCDHHLIYTEVPIHGTYIETYMEEGSGCYASYKTRESNIHLGAFLAAINDRNLVVVAEINKRQNFSFDVINGIYRQMYLFSRCSDGEEKIKASLDILKYFGNRYPDFILLHKEDLFLRARIQAFPNVCFQFGPPGPIGFDRKKGITLYVKGNELLLSYLVNMGYLTEENLKQVAKCRKGEIKYH